MKKALKKALFFVMENKSFFHGMKKEIFNKKRISSFV